MNAGDKVYFGRANGEQTLGEVLKVNEKTVRVVQLEPRGVAKAHPVGTVWKVPRSEVRPARPSGMISAVRDPSVRNEEDESVLSFDYLEDSRAASDVPEAPGDTRIEKLRAIVAARSAMCVEGQPVDLFSANHTVQVYEALSESRREGFIRMGSVLDVITLGFRVVERARKKAS